MVTEVPGYYPDERGILNLIHQIQEETPFSALGFFDIGRSTLVSIAATTVTYNIILLQFDG